MTWKRSPDSSNSDESSSASHKPTSDLRWARSTETSSLRRPSVDSRLYRYTNQISSGGQSAAIITPQYYLYIHFAHWRFKLHVQCWFLVGIWTFSASPLPGVATPVARNAVSLKRWCNSIQSGLEFLNLVQNATQFTAKSTVLIILPQLRSYIKTALSWSPFAEMESGDAALKNLKFCPFVAVFSANCRCGGGVTGIWSPTSAPWRTCACVCILYAH